MWPLAWVKMLTHHGAHVWREGTPMEALTEHETEMIIQRLETLVVDLEHDLRTPTLYAFVLVAHEFAGAKKAQYTLAQIRRCLTLAHRLRAIRDVLVAAGGR